MLAAGNVQDAVSLTMMIAIAGHLGTQCPAPRRAAHAQTIGAHDRRTSGCYTWKTSSFPLIIHIAVCPSPLYESDYTVFRRVRWL